MDNFELYNINSAELNELIDSVKVELKNTNDKYQNLMDQVSKIKKENPNLQSLFENDLVKNLNEKECKNLQKIFDLYLEISIYEEQKIFFLGGKELYLYFKKMNLIRE